MTGDRKPLGRPRGARKKLTIRLSDAERERAERIGDGKASLGVQRALAITGDLATTEELARALRAMADALDGATVTDD